MSQQVFLHVGLPKTGTTALQALLADNRAALAAQGLLYPFTGPDGLFRGAVDVVGWKLWGVDPSRSEGAWAALCDKVRAHPGPSVISHEILGRAKRHRVDRALEGLAGLDVHVVITARDLARQVTAVWQERVKNGRRYDFERFLEVEGVLGVDRRERRSAYFWKEQDLVGVLRRWTRDLPPERVHVVTCPPPGASDSELVRRFGSALGTDLTGFPAVEKAANRSLGLAETELLRQVNVALHDRITQTEYVGVVKRHFTKSMLGGRPGPRAVAPASVRDAFETVSGQWVRAITKAGYAVHGDLADLTTMTFADDRRLPEAAAADLVAGAPALMADLLVEVADLRRHGQDHIAGPRAAQT